LATERPAPRLGPGRIAEALGYSANLAKRQTGSALARGRLWRWLAIALLASGPALAAGGRGGNGPVSNGGAGGAGPFEGTDGGNGDNGGDGDISSGGAGGGGGGAGGGTGGTGGSGSNGTSMGAGGTGGGGGSTAGQAGVDGDVGPLGTNGGGGGGGGGAHGFTGTALPGGGLTGGDGGNGGDALFPASNGGGGGGEGGYGAYITVGGANTNTGTVAGGHGGDGGNSGGFGGSGGAGGIGIFFENSATLTNDGTILGGAGGSPGNSSFNILGAEGPGGAGVAGGGLAIINDGTIAGGLGSDGVRANAITFTGGANSLEVHAGSTITGNVVLQSGATGTLILGGDTSATFDASSIGDTAQYQGFGALEKTGASTWTLTGTAATAAPWTVTGGLINFSSAANFGTGTITLNGGGLQWATGSATDISGQLAAIGAGGGTFDTNGNDVIFATGLTGPGSLTKTGAGTLTLAGTNTYGGPTTIDAGVLAVNGSLASNTTVSAGGTLQGTGTITGTVTVAGTIAPGNSIGTLTVNGNYTQIGAYTVEVNAAGQSDRINVTGTANLTGGTVAVQAAAGTYRRNTTYTILSATGGLGGTTYSGVTSNFAFLTPSLDYSGTDVMLTLQSTAISFQGGAQTPNQRAVGVALDGGAPGASGDFDTALNALYTLDSTQGPAALDALGGQGYAGFASLQIQSALLFMDTFQFRAGSGGGDSASLPGGSTYMALRADACGSACDVEPLWGVWGGGMGAFGTVAGDYNGKGLTYNLGGFIAGIDRRVAPGFRAGVAAGFNAATLYTNGMPGIGTSNTLQVALYGAFNEAAFYLDALAGYGHSDNRMTRPIVIPGLPFRSAQGYTTANTFFGQLEAGYRLVVAPRFGGFVTPFARLQASTSTQAGFSETGADSLNLTIAQQTTNSLRTVLGAQLGAGLDAPWDDELNLVFRLGWSHEYADLSRPVTAAFAGAPALGFTTFGAQAPRDGVVVGLGADTEVAESTTAYLRYDGDLAGGNTNHVLHAGVRMTW
jgi:uncharacterized protein with beta-barrel porin domain